MAAAVLTLLAAPLSAQTPQPFPKPGSPSSPRPPAPAPTQAPAGEGQKVLPPQSRLPPGDASAANEPTEATLGLPIYPGARYLTSYDAGRGQRYYLFGTNIEFAQIVNYYRSTLRQRGDVAFETPPIHMFEVGRFREESMAFPPSITVKDYGWGGSEGYLHLTPAGESERFRTIIQIVPPPPGASR